jgi:hypothetical protein
MKFAVLVISPSVLRRLGFTIDRTPVLVVCLTYWRLSTDMLIPNARLQQNIESKGVAPKPKPAAYSQGLPSSPVVCIKQGPIFSVVDAAVENLQNLLLASSHSFHGRTSG